MACHLILNTTRYPDYIAVEDENGCRVGVIKHFPPPLNRPEGRELWIAQPDRFPDSPYVLGAVAFKSLEAAEFYILAMAIEGREGNNG